MSFDYAQWAEHARKLAAIAAGYAAQAEAMVRESLSDGRLTVDQIQYWKERGEVFRYQESTHYGRAIDWEVKAAQHGSLTLADM